MTMQVTIGLNAETLSAISDLAAAIRSISGVVASAPSTTNSAATASVKTGNSDKVVEKETGAGAEAVTIYWGNHGTATYGTVDSEEAYKALKKKDAKLVKLTQAQYDKKLAEIAAAAKAAGAGDDDEDAPTEQDVIDAFSAYLPADLDEELKAERRTFVKLLAGRFDAKKASAIPEEHRKLAINLVNRKAAGQDVDPEADEFEEFDADEDSLV